MGRPEAPLEPMFTYNRATPAILRFDGPESCPTISVLNAHPQSVGPRPDPTDMPTSPNVESSGAKQRRILPESGCNIQPRGELIAFITRRTPHGVGKHHQRRAIRRPRSRCDYALVAVKIPYRRSTRHQCFPPAKFSSIPPSPPEPPSRHVSCFGVDGYRVALLGFAAMIGAKQKS